MGADLLALGKSEQRDADGVVLGQRLAHYLSGSHGHLVCQPEYLTLPDVFKICHNAFSFQNPDRR
jgi:hypothetical protein